MTTTRTIGPLHFEDLEPHRFEDLVRQLAYDFRDWHSVEAIGRAGSDKGMDIRAVEAFRSSRADLQDAEDATEEDEVVPSQELRTWVFQCKRQARIGPRQAESIVKEFVNASSETPYGYVLAAACDFSAAARDTFRRAANAAGFEEFLIWGKGEIEDRLFLPKYDHLLFAYFGISLRARRRSASRQLGSRLALKRRLVKQLGEIREKSHKPVLVRDALDNDYPRIRDLKTFIQAPGWRYWHVYGHQPVDHLAVVFRKNYAYADWDASEYDVLPLHDEGVPRDPLVAGTDHQDWDPESIGRIYHAYLQRNVPEQNHAWLIELRFIHYDRILLVDEIGDAHNPGPHLVLDCSVTDGLWEPDWSVALLRSVRNAYQHPIRVEDFTRVEFFPGEVPDERDEWRKELQSRGSQS